ncbi:MAG: ATP-dependent 6-phosphofructokinase [Oscillospiraceae bacterium]|nr:ATP-dependent 6-phosphofructokinase [Oscillospiraceae bacterium]
MRKRIAVLTSGGDAPGMNAIIRSVVRFACREGFEIWGVEGGYRGLINGELNEIDALTVTNIIHKGGTILYTERCEAFKTEAGQLAAKSTCQKFEIDALIIIGGDGSLTGAMEFADLGVPCIGLPATIDNDVVSSEYSIGFDTATNTAIEMVDKLRDTTQSHNRCLVVEVMGRNSGNLALNVAVACGAVAVLVPERDTTESERILIRNIKAYKKAGMHNLLVIVSEGYKNKQLLVELISKEVNCEIRTSVLGYVQRGGTPTSKDRILASQMGELAVELVKNEKLNKVIVAISGEIAAIPLSKVLEPTEKTSANFFELVNNLVNMF